MDRTVRTLSRAGSSQCRAVDLRWTGVGTSDGGGFRCLLAFFTFQGQGSMEFRDFRAGAGAR